MIEDERRKRLLYRAQHRGFKEADLLIGGYAAARLQSMSAAELDEFETLIALADHDLYDFIRGERQAPAALDGAVLRALREFIAAPGG